MPTCPDANQLGAFLDAKLEGDDARAVERHLDECAACQELVALSARAGADADPAPVDTHGHARGGLVGRYVVLDAIGAGAMGVVYAAFDPKLDRKVALKLVRNPSAPSRARLEREARLAARLQHPNVIAIHDVGTVMDEVFVAMEHIDGDTLADWCRGRSQREILGVFAQAGRGLQAAHAAGLVHRDFKPSNAIVGRDGRVRVVDFGLARALVDGSDDVAEPGDPAGAVDVTHTGALVGSPAYMSPEQHRGQIADARADQFAFCVALYEALYGARPFSGDSIAALAERVAAGKLDDAPRGASVPQWLRRVLLRGLSVDPGARFSSMAELVGAIERDPTAARRRRWAAALLVLLVAGAATTVLVRRQRRVAACRSAVRAMAAHFDGAVAARVKAGLVATGAPFAATVDDTVAKILGDVVGNLAAETGAACRSDDDAELSQRRACLSAHAAEVDEMVAHLEHADRDFAERAVEAVLELPSSCQDLRNFHPAPAMPALAAGLTELRELMRAGRWPAATARADALLAEARAAHVDPLTELDLMTRAATLHVVNRDDEGAVPRLYAATVAAERLGRDVDAASLLDSLAFVVGYRKHEYALAHQLAALGAAKAERAGNQLALQSKLLATESAIFEDEGRNADAEPLIRRAVAIDEQVYGVDHPRLAPSLGALGNVLSAQGKLEEALAVNARVDALLTRWLGPDHPSVAGSLVNLGAALAALQRPAEARDKLRRADAIVVRVLGADHTERVAILGNLGDVEKQLGHYDDAAAALRSALGIVERNAGPSSPDAGAIRSDIADVLLQQHRHADAVAEALRSLAILEAALGPKHPRLVSPLVRLAASHLALGHARAALPFAERALAIDEQQSGGDPSSLAESRLLVATALWDSGGDHRRAIELAKASRRDGHLAGIDLAQVDDWLTKHR